MFARLLNGTVAEYPYSFTKLRADNPNTSFPANPSTALLAAWNVVPVEPVEQPAIDRATHKLAEGVPVRFGNVWRQAWQAVPLSAQEAAGALAAQWEAVRAERDALLAASDWTQLPDAPVDAAAWAVYRQALRDVTQQADPFAIVWPVAPT